MKKFESQMSPESSFPPTISRLPPLKYVDTELPIPCISWLSRIPDDKRLRFGFTNGALQRLQIKAPNYELPNYHFGLLDYRDPLPNRSETSALFQQVDRIASNFSTRFFVRDNDLQGNNRLYESDIITEYHDGKYAYSKIPTRDNLVSRWEQYREPISAVDIPNRDRNERTPSNLDTTGSVSSRSASNLDTTGSVSSRSASNLNSTERVSLRTASNLDTTESYETSQWRRVMYVSIQTLRSTCGAPAKIK
jgi:hypothetical protein